MLAPRGTATTTPTSAPPGSISAICNCRCALHLGALQVDATWHGHHHSYQRTCPLFHGRCRAAEADGTAGGAVHLVIGEQALMHPFRLMLLLCST